MNFVDKSLNAAAGIVRSGYAQWETSAADGFLQRIDARIKLVLFLFFIVLVSVKKDPVSELLVFLLVFLAAVVSRLDLRAIYSRVLFAGFFFGLLVVLPSATNLVTDGEVVLPLLALGSAKTFWIYRIPGEIGFTREGLLGAAVFCLRVLNSVSLSLVVVYSTPFFGLIRALRMLRVPDSLVMIILLSHKYIFILSRTIEDFYLALKSRLVGRVGGPEARGIIAGRIFLIFKKSRDRYEEVYRAMLCRGFDGSVRFPGMERPGARDIAVLLAGLTACAAIGAL